MFALATLLFFSLICITQNCIFTKVTIPVLPPPARNLGVDVGGNVTVNSESVEQEVESEVTTDVPPSARTIADVDYFFDGADAD